MTRIIRVVVAVGILSPLAIAGCSGHGTGEDIGTTSQQLFTFGWSGNTDEGSVASKLLATTNFAVMSNTGSGADTFGTGFADFDNHFVRGITSPALDTSARYLYVYQDVSDTPSTLNLGEVWTKMPGVSVDEITSWGYFSDTGFQDVKGPTDAANPFGWPNPQSPNTAHLGVSDPDVISIAGGTDPGVNPTVVYLANVNTGTYVTFRRAWVGPTGVEPGHRGVILGYTSNFPPTLNPNGANPEPVTIPQGLVAAEAPITTPPTIHVAPGSADARGVEELVNLVTGMYLINSVDITPESAKNIEDAGEITSVQQLETLVTGPDFDRLVRFARANGYVQ